MQFRAIALGTLTVAVLDITEVILALFAHVFCVGIPAALSTRWRPAAALRYAR